MDVHSVSSVVSDTTGGGGPMRGHNIAHWCGHRAGLWSLRAPSRMRSWEEVCRYRYRYSLQEVVGTGQ